MNEKHWPILGVQHVARHAFVGFWERLYTGYDEEFYQTNIGQPLTPERIADWFAWKNGRPLSAKKIRTIRRYLSLDERIDRDAGTEALQKFLNRPGGAIWRIFWLHLQHPEHFPIYDQHVHRAMAYLQGWPRLEIPRQNPAKVRAYLENYRAFFASFKDGNPRRADRALWSFGKFLRTEYAHVFREPFRL
ncbi:DNA glycosylase family protein [Lignipirellula cremea]|uniref:Uncharacterized protein n=1 Tax=Lignipirellula cremea TaxID=2528010 RepID=A0A518DLD2_9BACT|nr:hypothetical protein [Lignipirellula cremea]QDU92646.1 hypothetical protein Pla8534_03940 [Lignipirellula cremea]